MRNIAFVLSLVVAADLLPGQRPDERDRPEPKYRNLEFRVDKFECEALGGRMHPYAVFLPKDYDDKANAEKRYPLVIWLHGLWEDHRRFATRGGGEILDEAVGEDVFPEAIFVCAEGDRGSFWLDGNQDDRKYETMVVDDLLEHVVETYRVKEGRGQRAIAGVSMGGLGALKIAFKHPEKFGVVSAHSAAILSRDPDDIDKEFPALRRAGRMIEQLFGDPIDEKRYGNENPLTLADAAETEDLQSLRIRFDCGSSDRYGFAKTNVRLHELLEKREVEHEWKLVKGGNHGWRSGYNTDVLPDALRFLARSFATEKGLSGLRGLGVGGDDDKDDDAHERKKPDGDSDR